MRQAGNPSALSRASRGPVQSHCPELRRIRRIAVGSISPSIDSRVSWQNRWRVLPYESCADSRWQQSRRRRTGGDGFPT